MRHISSALLALLISSPVLSPRQLQDQVAINTPFVSTTPNVVTGMLRLAAPKSEDIIYDLGCGDGRIIIAAAKRYSIHGVGIDINPDRIREARANARFAGVDRLVSFEEGDLFETDLRRATIVTLYLLHDVNLKLRPKLQRELPPGARIVAESFDLGDWKPAKKEKIDGADLFLWVMPQPRPQA